MKAVILVQSRLGSSRLPQKAFKLIAGHSLIAHVIARCLRTPFDVVLLTPEEELKAYQNKLAAEVDFLKYPTSRLRWVGGPEANVWKRFELAIRGLMDEGYEHFIRITGDCPLVCPDLILDMYQCFRETCLPGNIEFIHNDTKITGYSDGLDVEIFTGKFFLACHPENDYEFEHVTPAMQKAKSPALQIAEYQFPSLKLSVDEQKDLDLMEKIFKEANGNPPDTVLDLTEFLHGRKWK